MAGAFTYTAAVVVFPFLSFLLALAAALYDENVLPKRGALPGIAATGGSLVLAGWLALAVGTQQAVYQETLYRWAVAADASGTTTELTFGVLVDPLSALMLVVVSLVGLLVHVFSLGYMNGENEPGLARYYAGLGLFTASMLGFVVADNLLQSFVFFELVGLCSYLLIGFHFREDGPPSAAKKAFLVTRFGDYFFLIGVVGVFATFGTASFVGGESFPHLAETVVSGENTAGVETFGFDPQLWFTVLGLLVLGGVIGKSAQFPLHTWLPDAMEGPTPVSALIHAATMVAAGVYLVARMYGFFAVSPTALAVIALVGGFTALFAATMGVVKRELKQVLAYSTISQYGYMLLALGAGGYVAATFHLLTHAFFKALLFLGAGSVIVAMHHDENMWNMGGLRERLPITYYPFLAGSFALAGIVPFAGFWSKDELLYETVLHGVGTDGGLGTVLLAAYAAGLVAVAFTGFYTFRMVLLTFHGDPRTEQAASPDSVGWSIKAPLVVLGTLAATVGLVNMVPVKKLTGVKIDYLHQWLNLPADGLSAHHYEALLAEAAGVTPATGFLTEPTGVVASAGASLGLAAVGSVAAYALYAGPEPTEQTRKLGVIRDVLYNNYYQDEYQVWIAGVVARVAGLADTFDQSVIDGVVNGVSGVSLVSGSRLRQLQTGAVNNYAALVTLGVTLLVVAFGLYEGWLL